MGRIWVHLKKWWRAHFNGFTRRERWGYGVWLIFGVIVLVPELWAAFWKDSAPFPTISGTTADLEYGSPILGLVVVGVIVICLYSAMRFPPSKTGVLARQNPSPDDLPTYVGEDPFLPYRTPGGGRFTRSKTPVRELAAEIYFSVVFAVILVATTIAALVTGGPTSTRLVGRSTGRSWSSGWCFRARPPGRSASPSMSRFRRSSRPYAVSRAGSASLRLSSLRGS